MRCKYRLDEIGDGKDELKFKQGQKTIVTIYIHEDKFTFLIIFGKKERECFEMQKSGFSEYVCDYYDNSKTWIGVLEYKGLLEKQDCKYA